MAEEIVSCRDPPGLVGSSGKCRRELCLRFCKIEVQLELGTCCLAGQQHAVDVRITLQVGFVQLAGLGDRSERQAEFGKNPLHQLINTRTARQTRDSLMELQIGGADGTPVPRVRRRPRTLNGRSDVFDRARRGGGEASDCIALHHSSQIVQIVKILDRQFADKHASIELMNNQPLVSEQAKCLPERVAGNLKGAPNRILGKPGTRRYVALNDARAHHLCDPLDRVDSAQQGPISLKVRPLHRCRHAYLFPASANAVIAILFNTL